MNTNKRIKLFVLAAFLVAGISAYFYFQRSHQPAVYYNTSSDVFELIPGSELWRKVTSDSLSHRKEQLKNTPKEDPSYAALKQTVERLETDLKQYEHKGEPK